MRFYLCYLCLAFSSLITSLYGTLTKRDTLYEHSPCQNQNGTGICTRISKCPQAISDVNKHKTHYFTRCEFADGEETVCCPTFASRFSETQKSEKACESYAESFSDIVFPQIAGGQEAKLGQFPYMAALGFYNEGEKKYYFRCGGTLISKQYILTAAHCLWNQYEEEVKIVRLGVVNVPEYIDKIDETIDFEVTNYTIHPDYKRRSMIHDIGLVKMNKSIEIRNDLRPACLFTNSSNYPQEFVITGWGIVDENYNRKITLQKAVVKLEHFQDCAKKYIKARKQLQESQLCAGDIMSDICVGDSGGPLLMRNSDIPLVVGVSSFGQPGCSGGISVYTSVSQHLDWIENIVWS